jgi:bifunctional non-homologous end joining protein LigD
MKRAPSPRPDWIRDCAIEHGSGSVIDFRSSRTAGALGCEPRLHRPNRGTRAATTPTGRTTCTSISIRRRARPLRSGAGGALVLEGDARRLKMPSYPKTTGSRGIHVYVPIVRGTDAEAVWAVAKTIARFLGAQSTRELITPNPSIGERPDGARAGRLQPERVGAHAGLRLLRAPAPPRRELSRGRVSEVERGIRIETFGSTTLAGAGSPDRGDLFRTILCVRAKPPRDARGVRVVFPLAPSHRIRAPRFCTHPVLLLALIRPPKLVDLPRGATTLAQVIGRSWVCFNGLLKSAGPILRTVGAASESSYVIVSCGAFTVSSGLSYLEIAVLPVVAPRSEGHRRVPSTGCSSVRLRRRDSMSIWLCLVLSVGPDFSSAFNPRSSSSPASFSLS